MVGSWLHIPHYLWTKVHWVVLVGDVIIFGGSAQSRSTKRGLSREDAKMSQNRCLFMFCLLLKELLAKALGFWHYWTTFYNQGWLSRVTALCRQPSVWTRTVKKGASKQEGKAGCRDKELYCSQGIVRESVAPSIFVSKPFKPTCRVIWFIICSWSRPSHHSHPTTAWRPSITPDVYFIKQSTRRFL